MQLLSDCGAAFLSHLLIKICELLGVEKLNTTTYHPGLAEHLTEMLAKRVEQSGRDVDAHLPFMLLLTVLVYRSQQNFYCMDVKGSSQLPFGLDSGQ